MTTSLKWLAFFYCLLELFFTRSTTSIKLVSKLDFVVDRTQTFIRQIKFENNEPPKHEQARCSAISIASNETYYITGFDPIADKSVVHHMTLTACERLPDASLLELDGNTWTCGLGGELVCDESRNETVHRLLYMWALGAKGVEFPSGAGFRVSGDTRLNYLVINAHLKTFPKGFKMASNMSYTLKMTRQQLPYQVGIYTLASDGLIPPKREKSKLNTGCIFEAPYDIAPMFYRVHTHELGNVVSGYLVRNQKWIELGRMSPQMPQAFYPLTNSDLIVNGSDTLTSMCVFNTTKERHMTFTGGMHVDEMCIFYLMYYTDYLPNIYDDLFCDKLGNKFKWSDLKISTKMPENADNTDGIITQSSSSHSSMKHAHVHSHL